jgi:putative hydrolase of the HAD superfamily
VSNVLPELPDPEAAFTALWAHFGRSSAWRCFEDVAPTIRFLSEVEIPIRIASNFDSRLHAVVEGLPELSSYAITLVISSEVGWRKPHRCFYQLACESLGMAPERVLCVGDDLENDFLAPRRARLEAILLDRTEKHPEISPRIPDLRKLIRP